VKKGMLFDLDGTLWDSAEGVAASWNLELEELGRDERVDADYVHSIMGKTGREIAMNLFPDEDPEEAERIMDLCLTRENAYLQAHGGVLFEGLEETLRTLRDRGYFLGIVSNCQKGYIEAFMRFHGLEAYVDDLECYGQTGKGKGENIRLVVERNRLDAVYLGDTMGDYTAAAEAGVPFIHAAYGFGTVPEGTPSIHSIGELPGALEALGYI